MTEVDYSSAAIESRLAVCGELHRLGSSLRDARSRPGVERPVFEAIVRGLARRFRAIEDLDSTYVWTQAVYGALAVDSRMAVARSLGLDPSALNAPHEGKRGFDFSWVSRDAPTTPVLVAESEWGKANNADANDREVRRDFEKLLGASAPYRVLVHSTHAGTRHELEQKLSDAAAQSAAPTSFLFVSLEWDSTEEICGMRAWRLRDIGGRPVREDMPIPTD